MEQDRVDQKLGNYILRSILGTGGFATVYLGEHVVIGSKRQAAVKVLKTVALTDTARDKFLKEARTIARLTHPNIIRVIDCGVDIQAAGSTPYIAMSYATNGNVRNEYPQGTILPFDVVLSYVQQAAEALQYAHDQNIVHCDVKPENILLGGSNQILLADFGIANISHTADMGTIQDDIYSDPTMKDEIQGTVTYMAPERFQNVIRRSSDQYSLGVVVYEWLTGNPPFTGSREKIIYQHLTAQPPSLHMQNPQVSAAIDQAVLRSLEKEPEKRYNSVKEFAAALEKAISALPSHRPALSSSAPSSVPAQVKQELSTIPTASVHLPGLLPNDLQRSNAQSVEDRANTSLSSSPSSKKVPPSKEVGTTNNTHEPALRQNPSLAALPQQDELKDGDSIRVPPLVVEDVMDNRRATFRVPPPLPPEEIDELATTPFSSSSASFPVDAAANARPLSGTSPSAEDDQEDVAAPWSNPGDILSAEDDQAATVPSSSSSSIEDEVAAGPTPDDPIAGPTPWTFSPPPDDPIAGPRHWTFSSLPNDPAAAGPMAQSSTPIDDPSSDPLAMPNMQSNRNARSGTYTGWGSAGGNSSSAWQGGTSNIPMPPAGTFDSNQAVASSRNSISPFSGLGTSLGNIVELESDFARQREWRRFRQAGLTANFLCAIAAGLIVHSWSIFLLGLLVIFAFWLCIRLVKPFATGLMSLGIALYWGYFGISLTKWLLNFPAFSTLPIPLIIGAVFFIISIGLHINYLVRRLV